MANLIQSYKLTQEPQHPPFRGFNLTNRVFIQQYDEGKQLISKKNIVYYCPAYIRLKIKNFSEMSLEDLSSTINVVLCLTIRLNNIPERLQQEIRKKMVLRFNRDPALALGGSSQQVVFKNDKQDGQYSYFIRKLLHAGMKAEIFLSPFQLIYLILTINIQSIEITKQKIHQIVVSVNKNINSKIQQISKLKEGDQKKEQQKILDQMKEQIEYLSHINKINVFFNSMDFGADVKSPQHAKKLFNKISYTSQGTFGNYDLAQKRLDARYTNEQLSQVLKDKNSQSVYQNQHINYEIQRPFQYAHFTIPLYKFPGVTLFTIFIPLWLLGVINLGIFFQDTGLGDRIGSLAALLIAFVALIPVIRAQIPPSPHITFVQILVYLETMTTLFCFIQSIMVRGDETYQFNPWGNGLFLVSVIIGLLQVAIIIILAFIHNCYWLKSYNSHVNDIQQLNFNANQWQNKECDLHFRRKIDTNNMRILRSTSKQLQRIKKKKEQKEKQNQKNKPNMQNMKPQQGKPAQLSKNK